MAIVEGKDIYIYAGSSGSTPIVAAAKSCIITSQCDIFERASASQPYAKEYVAGRYDWELSLDHLVTTGAPFDGLLKVRNSYTLSIVINGVRRTGRAICQKADIRGTIKSLGTGSVKFKGSGSLI